MNIIYIDVLITVNLFIDYLILFSVKRLLHIQTKHIRILLGALFASISTPIIFAEFYTELVSIFFKPFISSLTIIFSFGFHNFKKFIIRTGMFWGLSMALCGALAGIEQFLNPKRIIVYRDTPYLNISPVSLVLFTLGAYITLSIYDRLKGQHNLRCKIINVTIYTPDNVKINFESAIDTGLNLKEPFSGSPVILAEKTLIKNSYIPREKMRIIPFSTASGDGIVYGFKPEKLYLNGKKATNNCYIAITENKLKGEVKSIMGEELAESI